MNGTTSPPIDSELHDRLAELESDRAQGRRFFWKWLIAATMITMLGNAGHALLPPEAPSWVRLVVALVPPLIAGVAVHGVMVLSRVGHGDRAGASAKRTFRVAVAVTVLLALDAAIISFAGLYGVAISAGFTPVLAALFPISIDFGIAVSTLALYHLRPSSAADLRAAHEALEAERADRERERIAREREEEAEQIRLQDERNRLEDERIAQAMEREARALAAAERAQAQVSDIDRVNDRPLNGRSPDHVNGSVNGHVTERMIGYARPIPERVIEPVTDDPYLNEARSLIERTGKRSDAAAVAEVLRRLDGEVPVAQISTELGMGERTIRQIRDSRKELLAA